MLPPFHSKLPRRNKHILHGCKEDELPKIDIDVVWVMTWYDPGKEADA